MIKNRSQNLPDINMLAGSRGFTLLELLISISLTAILMTVLVVGLNAITRDWGKQGDKLNQKLDESLLLLQLEKAILGTYPYYFKENELAKEQLFFSGSKTGISWVSTVSTDRSNGLKLWHLKQNDNGGFNLDVLPVYPGNIKKQLGQFKNKQTKVSSYFSNYKISLHFLSENKQKMKQWTTQWDAKDKEKLPLGIRIVFQQKDAHRESDSQNKQKDYELFGFIRAKGKARATSFGGGDGRKGLGL